MSDGGSAERVTRLLREAAENQPHAASELLPLVYDELRKLARARMAGERANHTLQPTGLVHEAYVRLVGDGAKNWANRAHFFHAAAEAMRRILIDHARARMSEKRGGAPGARCKLPIDLIELVASDDPSQMMELEEAVATLEKLDAQAANVVRLRFYGGLTVDEVAGVLNTSARTVKRDWAFARAHLLRAMSP